MEFRYNQLSQVDDWELYAKGLEAWVGRWQGLTARDEEEDPSVRDSLYLYPTVIRLIHEETTHVLREACDRIDRLRDASIGLPNGKLEEEGS